MKYEVLGFYQQRAVELGLCSDDLLVLRWFVDFAGTNKMQSMIIDNQIYYWVNYSTVLEELPILKISKQTLYKKHFTNLCNANVLIHKQVKEGGNFSYYCYGINYDTLVYLQTNDPLVKNTDLMSNSTKGCVEIEQTLVSNSTEQRLVNNNIHLQDNYKEKDKEKEKSFSASHLEIFDYWNSKNIIPHKELTEKVDKAITKAMKTYSIEQIKEYIDRYAKVFKDTEWYFDTKWSLDLFLTQKNAISHFTDEGSKWLSYQNRKQQGKNFLHRDYTKEELDAVYDSLDDVEI